MLFRSDRKSTRLNSSHTLISYAVFCLKKKADAHVPAEPESLRFRARVRNEELPRDITVLFFFLNDTATTEIYTLSLRDALPINDTATTEIYTLSLHDALPISVVAVS